MLTAGRNKTCLKTFGTGLPDPEDENNPLDELDLLQLKAIVTSSVEFRNTVFGFNHS